jgi:hypothetical protein
MSVSILKRNTQGHKEQRAIRLVFTGFTFRIFPTRYSVRYRIVRTFEDG